MNTQLGICACIGPPGDCPCIRLSKGLPIAITETTISPELFALLSDEDKQLINDLKLRALDMYLHKTKGSPLPVPSRTTRMKHEAVVELCDQSHYFLKSPDHPKDDKGLARCPHCLASGLDKARVEISELEDAIAQRVKNAKDGDHGRAGY